jgi:hypothetical protein
LPGLNHLVRINRNLIFDDNPNLVNFTGFDNLKFITGDLQILECNNLTSLTGLEKLVAVYGNMEIYYNPKLSNYCTLKLTTFNGTAYISSNAYNPTYAEIKAGKCSN